ncbi:MAG: type II toxin-antitoxin system VapB family antitoxin [Pseudomonadota bacterium]
MARTNIDIDDVACEEVMRRYDFSTKREAVNFALRQVAREPLDLKAARAMRGAGWEGTPNSAGAQRVEAAARDASDETAQRSIATNPEGKRDKGALKDGEPA